MDKIRRALILLIAFAGLTAIVFVWQSHSDASSPTQYRMNRVTRGELVSSISATGTLEPEEVIDVGAQVAGQIKAFGRDQAGKPIDYGSSVEEGTVLAEIDQSLYAADLAQARAQLEVDQAGVQKAEADLEQFKARLSQAQLEWQRVERLGPSSSAISLEQYEAYRLKFEVAKANVASAQAAIVQAKANVWRQQAVVERAERNLSYCTIKSPVKGVIIDRRVNIGQTVVSSLNAPSLFLIAKDLTRMQVWIAVNEADIGNIRPGQAVTFTVDAFPNQVFEGSVGKIRLNATMTQNVVTYTVEVVTENPDGKLLPYLTANAQFEVARHRDVLRVPNAALRWAPAAAEVPPGANLPARPTSASRGESSITNGRLWVAEGDQLRPVGVQTGITDGSMTEVRSDELQEGVQVVIGELAAGVGAGPENTNPFAPHTWRSRGSSAPQR